MPEFDDPEVIDYIARQECRHWDYMPEDGVDCPDLARSFDALVTKGAGHE